MREAYIVDFVRTPIGRFGGALAAVRTDDLGAVPIRALRERHPGIDWAGVDRAQMRDAMARLIYTGVTGRTPPS